MVENESELRALMLRSRAGDAAATRAFLAKVAAGLRGFYRSRLASAPEDAEDLVQETLIALHTKRDTYDPAFPVTAWIYAIARYRLIDHWRRKKVRGHQTPVEDVADLSVEAEDAAVDSRYDLERLLAQIPQKQRDAIRLVKLDGLSVRDASERLGFSESDIKISTHRGMKALARLIGRQEA